MLREMTIQGVSAAGILEAPDRSGRGSGNLETERPGRGKLNDTMGDEQSTHDEHPVFWKGKPQSTENQKAEAADICEVLNNHTRFNHTVTRKATLLSELCPLIEDFFRHLC